MWEKFGKRQGKAKHSERGKENTTKNIRPDGVNNHSWYKYKSEAETRRYLLRSQRKISLRDLYEAKVRHSLD